MARHRIAAGLILMASVAATPAYACATHSPLDPRAVQAAQVVVVGRITAYRLESAHGARFEMAVEQVLRGQAGRILAGRLDPTMYGAPRTAPRGRVLIAMRHLPSPSAPRHPLAVLQGMCSAPFIVADGSEQAAVARRVLARGRD